MGKCGGHELNYVSDVDVIFVSEPRRGRRRARRAAGRDPARDPPDAGLLGPHRRGHASGRSTPDLRPEGKAGPLVRTLASHLGYYERWAKTWEFQALLKARPVAGDLALGREYVDMLAADGVVGRRARRLRRGRAGDAPPGRRAHPRRRGRAPAQARLGRAARRGVRRPAAAARARPRRRVRAGADDAERAGRADRRAATSAARTARRCTRPTCFLRTLEHRIQLYQLRRTHVVPEDEASLRRLGRSMGYIKEPVDELDKEWKHHRREVRRLHEKLFYRPLLGAVARMPADEARLTPEAAKARLAALGYADPKAALRHLEALTSGVSRTAAIQRTLLPVMLEWFADAPDPDAGLFGLPADQRGPGPYAVVPHDCCATRARSPSGWPACSATSRYATDLLEREPQGVGCWGERSRRCPPRPCSREMQASVGAPDRRRRGGPRGPGHPPARAAPDRASATCSASIDVAEVG